MFFGSGVSNLWFNKAVIKKLTKRKYIKVQTRVLDINRKTVSSAFGSVMTGREYLGDTSKKYRYGFNGKENDNEVKGEGNQQDYGMRIYDLRLGRFLSVDPLTKSYPSWSPYPFAMNRPIDGVRIHLL